MRSHSIALLCLSPFGLLACVGGGGGGNAANAGGGSGTLRVTAAATCIVVTDAATCPVSLIVRVEDDATETEVNDATVTFGAIGSAGILVVQTSGSGGYYTGNTTGLADAYELSVVRGGDTLTGVVLVSPRDFEVTLDPDPPAASALATVSWSPNNRESVYSLVYVFSLMTGATYQDDQIFGDTGSRTLPATAFPAAGEYQLQVGRSSVLFLSSPFSTGQVIVGRQRPVTIP